METPEITTLNAQDASQHSQKKMGIAAVAVIAFLGVGVLYMQSANKSASDAANTVTSGSEMAASYKNGVYSVTGGYTSPAGPEQLGVTVTLENNVISDVSVEVRADKPISKKMQEDFAANYKSQVVGKKLSEVKLDKVSGSSLTPKGFNDALEQVKTQAQS